MPSAVDGVGGDQGNANVRLTIDSATPPENDNFASRVALTGETAVAASKLSGATSEVGEPQIVPITDRAASVWWSWPAGRAGRVWVSGKGQQSNGFVFSPEVAVYKGTQLGALEQVGVPEPAAEDLWLF